MILQAIDKMLADSTLIGLVGRNKKTDTYKIYPIACPQGEIIPYVTCGITSAEPILCKGVGGQPDDETFDVVVWEEDYKKLDDIGRRIVDVLNNASGFRRLTFITHRDALDNSSKYMVRIITFSGSI